MEKLHLLPKFSVFVYYIQLSRELGLLKAAEQGVWVLTHSRARRQVWLISVGTGSVGRRLQAVNIWGGSG